MALRGIGGLSIIPPKLRQLDRGVTVGQTADRQISKSIAHNLKAGGGASAGTGTRESLVGDLGGIAGEHFGGETGSAIGRTIGEFIGDIFGSGDDRPSVGNQQQLQQPQQPQQMQCPSDRILVRGQCVKLSAALPGGEPFTQTAGGATVMGGFGLPAMQPVVETRVHRSCGPGMVLGRDNLCYPKQVLGRRSRFRKWRAAPKPAVSAADMKAIRRAARAKDRVAKLGKDVGLSVSKTPKRKSRKDIENEIRLQILDHN